MYAKLIFTYLVRAILLWSIGAASQGTAALLFALCIHFAQKWAQANTMLMCLIALEIKRNCLHSIGMKFNQTNTRTYKHSVNRKRKSQLAVVCLQSGVSFLSIAMGFFYGGAVIVISSTIALDIEEYYQIIDGIFAGI